MPQSDAQRRAKSKYNAKAYDILSLRLKKGERDKVKQFAEAHGESLNGFAVRVIREAMEKESE